MDASVYRIVYYWKTDGTYPQTDFRRVEGCETFFYLALSPGVWERKMKNGPDAPLKRKTCAPRIFLITDLLLRSAQPKALATFINGTGRGSRP